MSFDVEAMQECLKQIDKESREARKGKIAERNVVVERILPWDNLSEQDFRDFMNEVEDVWNSEQYKERNMKDFYTIKLEVWERWDKTKLKQDKI